MEIEIWSDVACPWCYIGKRRFEAALERFEDRDQVRVTWRSFELDPEAPAEREGDLAQHLASKYGISVDEARLNQQRLAGVAAEEGLQFRFDRSRSGSTFDAHRLIHLAERHGLQDEAKERLLRAYFSDGELVSDTETLVRLAVEVGLPEQEAREALAGDRFAEEVREDERVAVALGISAVPTFVADRSIAASGAQPPEALLQLLQAAAERSAATAQTS
ncbi:MAG: DsbA family oxidoreductase [Solirubrobacteraceae bacterium]